MEAIIIIEIATETDIAIDTTIDTAIPTSTPRRKIVKKSNPIQISTNNSPTYPLIRKPSQSSQYSHTFVVVKMFKAI